MESQRTRLMGLMVVLVFVASTLVDASVQDVDAPRVAVSGRDPAGQSVPAAVVAHFHLGGALTESPMEDPFDLMGGQVMSLKDLVQRLDKARQDPKVRAVVLTFDRMALGLGQIEEVRGAILGLKDSGKKVYVHAEGMNTLVYALLSAGSRLSVAPQSTLWLTGLYGESLYLKGLLDKIGVDADLMHVGDYKSAAEMLTRTSPSPAAEENVNWLLDGLFDSLVRMIATSRGMPANQVRDLVDKGPYEADQALRARLIDSIETQDQFLDRIRQELGGAVTIDNRYGRDKQAQINFANPFAVFALLSELFRPPPAEPKDAVGLVYVEGMIVPGYGQPNPFGGGSGAFSGDIRKALDTAARDGSVKAVVLRVDSPGGSAEASEVILNAAQQVQARKPLVVSMGNVAGSGGYYVSCGANVIFADETTITASIGVVGGKLVTQALWDKLGVNWVGHKRGANADLFNTSRRFDDPQRKWVIDYMQMVYGVFKDHVVKGRAGKLAKPIDDLAGGRVYTGRQAMDLGLVDKVGGLHAAIEHAASLASLTDYEVRVIPRPKDFVTLLLEQISGEGERPTDLHNPEAMALAHACQPWATAIEGLQRTDPERVRAFIQALQRIELIRRESVIMMMPYDLVFVGTE